MAVQALKKVTEQEATYWNRAHELHEITFSNLLREACEDTGGEVAKAMTEGRCRFDDSDYSILVEAPVEEEASE